MTRLKHEIASFFFHACVELFSFPAEQVRYILYSLNTAVGLLTLCYSCKTLLNFTCISQHSNLVLPLLTKDLQYNTSFIVSIHLIFSPKNHNRDSLGILLALHCDDGTATITCDRAALPQPASSSPTERPSSSAVSVWRGLLALRLAGVTLPRWRGRGTELTSLSRGDLMSSSVTLPR